MAVVVLAAALDLPRRPIAHVRPQRRRPKCLLSLLAVGALPCMLNAVGQAGQELRRVAVDPRARSPTTVGLPIT